MKFFNATRSGSDVKAILVVLHRIAPFIADGSVSITGSVLMLLMLALKADITAEDFGSLLLAASVDAKSLLINDLDIVLKTSCPKVAKQFFDALLGPRTKAGKVKVIDRDKKTSSKKVGLARLKAASALLPDTMPDIVINYSAMMVVINSLNVGNGVTVDIRFDTTPVPAHTHAVTIYMDNGIDRRTIKPEEYDAKRAAWHIKKCFAWNFGQSKPYIAANVGDVLNTLDRLCSADIDLDASRAKFAAFVRDNANYIRPLDYYQKPQTVHHTFLATVRDLMM